MKPLPFCLVLSVAAASYAQSTVADAALKQAVSDSTACLSQHVSQRITAEKISITDEERSAVRMDVANACHEQDKKLAALSSEYISGVKTLRTVVEEMTAINLRLADTMIMTRVKTNAEKAK